MGPISVRGQKFSRQHVSKTNLSALSSRTYFRATSQLRVGHWTRDKDKKADKYLQKAATSTLIASQPTLWPH